MPNIYKKRAKGNWTVGKNYKNDSSERGYAKIEIKEELKADDPNYRVTHKAKRKRNDKARLQYRIDWYEKRIQEYEVAGHGSDSFVSYLRSGLKSALKEYEEKYGKK